MIHHFPRDGGRKPMLSMHPTVLNTIFLFIGFHLSPDVLDKWPMNHIDVTSKVWYLVSFHAVMSRKSFLPS